VATGTFVNRNSLQPFLALGLVRVIALLKSSVRAQTAHNRQSRVADPCYRTTLSKIHGCCGALPDRCDQRILANAKSRLWAGADALRDLDHRDGDAAEKAMVSGCAC